MRGARRCFVARSRIGYAVALGVFILDQLVKWTVTHARPGTSGGEDPASVTNPDILIDSIVPGRS